MFRPEIQDNTLEVMESSLKTGRAATIGLKTGLFNPKNRIAQIGAKMLKKEHEILKAFVETPQLP